MNDIKILLLRIGVDTGARAGKSIAPLFSDGTWSFIPIPDGPTRFPFTYSQINDQNRNSTIERWLGRKYLNYKPHFDPEFWTYTYGEPLNSKSIKVKQLKSLNENDILLFWAGLAERNINNPGPYDKNKHGRIHAYLIGKFVIDKVQKVSRRGIYDQRRHPTSISLNAHSLRVSSYASLIIKGKRDSSILYSKPLRLTDDQSTRWQPSSELRDEGFLKISIRSGSGNWLPPNAYEWIEEKISNERYNLWISEQELRNQI